MRQPEDFVRQHKAEAPNSNRMAGRRMAGKRIHQAKVAGERRSHLGLALPPKVDTLFLI